MKAWWSKMVVSLLWFVMGVAAALGALLVAFTKFGKNVEDMKRAGDMAREKKEKELENATDDSVIDSLSNAADVRAAADPRTPGASPDVGGLKWGDGAFFRARSVDGVQRAGVHDGPTDGDTRRSGSSAAPPGGK